MKPCWGGCRRIDDKAAQHLENEGVEFLQFAFRWVNCLLARELPFPLAVRLWDTYLAEGPRMKEFLIYVLASFVLSWSAELSRMEFQVQPDPFARQLVPLSPGLVVGTFQVGKHTLCCASIGHPSCSLPPPPPRGSFRGLCTRVHTLKLTKAMVIRPSVANAQSCLTHSWRW